MLANSCVLARKYKIAGQLLAENFEREYFRQIKIAGNRANFNL